MPNERWRILLPLSLTGLRAALAPVVLAFTVWPLPRHLLATIMIVAFLSDWFDGVLARRLGVAKPWLRRLDVWADSLFYLSAVLTAFLLEPEILHPYWLWIVGLLAAELTVHLWHWLRWRVSIATHAWMCKAFSVVMAASLGSLLACGTGGWLLHSAFVLGTVAYIDVILILLVATETPLDVISSWHVVRSSRDRSAA